MLVLLSVSLVSAGSDTEREYLKFVATLEAEKYRSAVGGYICVGTTTAQEDIADFARKNDLSKLACVNCKQRDGLYVDGIVLGCTKCNIHSLKSEYQSRFH